MSIRPVTFYEVACDESGCDVTTQSHGEYAAWSDRDGARDDWECSDGIVLDDGRAFCDEHRDRFRCDECGDTDATVAIVGATATDAGARRLCAQCDDAERGPDQPGELGVESLIGPHDRPLPLEIPGVKS